MITNFCIGNILVTQQKKHLWIGIHPDAQHQYPDIGHHQLDLYDVSVDVGGDTDGFHISGGMIMDSFGTNFDEKMLIQLLYQDLYGEAFDDDFD